MSNNSITTIIELEPPQLPTAEYRIMQPFVMKDGRSIHVFNESDIQVTDIDLGVGDDRVSVGAFIPKNVFQPVSTENPLTMSIVPSSCFHVNAKNLALLSDCGLELEQIQKFVESNSTLDSDQLKKAWCNYIHRFASSRFNSRPEDAERFFKILNEGYMKYPVGDQMKIGGTVSIRPGIPFISNPNFNYIDLQLFLESMHENQMIYDYEIAAKIVDGLHGFVVTNRRALQINNGREILHPMGRLNDQAYFTPYKQ